MNTMFKRFFSRLLFALLLLAGSGMSRSGAGLHAQNGIGFGSPGFSGMPDTTYASTSSILVGAYVKNFSIINCVDTLQIQGYIDTGSVVIPFTLPPVTNFQLPAGDSLFSLLPIAFKDNHMGGNFRIGNNVIVVWPVIYSPNWAAHDSLKATVFVIDTISGIRVNTLPEENVRCYPVPASGPMYITSTNPHISPKQVIVRDASGKVVFVSTTPMFGIETESWASGVYTLEVTFDNGAKGAYKVVK